MTTGWGGGEQRNTDSVAMGNTRKRCGISIGGGRGQARATLGNPPLRPPTRRGHGAAMGQGRRKGGEKEAIRQNRQ